MALGLFGTYFLVRLGRISFEALLGFICIRFGNVSFVWDPFLLRGIWALFWPSLLSFLGGTESQDGQGVHKTSTAAAEKAAQGWDKGEQTDMEKFRHGRWRALFISDPCLGSLFGANFWVTFLGSLFWVPMFGSSEPSQVDDS